MNVNSDPIDAPDSPRLSSLCRQLNELSELPDAQNQWPTKQLELIADAGVYHWFIPEIYGGMHWSSPDIVAGYIKLSAACLTTTFVITQRVAAIKRICKSQNETVRNRLLPGLLSGEAPATVGISHLTTSRRHVKGSVLRAEQIVDGFSINGFSPWVTGACGAVNVVMGAQMEDGRQVLFIAPTDGKGIVVEPGFELVGLSGSKTGAVKCDHVFVPDEHVLAGPVENVLTQGSGSATGSIQTSALALGLAKSAIDFIQKESGSRPDLVDKQLALAEQWDEIQDRLFKLASGMSVCTSEELRTEANSLVLRATQSAMVAAKGAGYVEGHPVGRWCREALFFLVWSCPQAVLDANLCELAGIQS
ncbi:MAG: acyl-CoA dehydrogenase family protein [Mariniblastus sp.]